MHCGSVSMFCLVGILTAITVQPEHIQAGTGDDNGSRHHYIGLTTGGGIASYREDLLVPISFDGPGFIIGGYYSAQSERSQLNIRLKFGIAMLKNRFSHKAYAATLELRPTWMRKVHGHVQTDQLWVGLAFPMQMNNLFMDSWDDAHLYWLTTHSFAFAAEYRIADSRLGCPEVRFELPVLGFVSRPPAYRYQKQEAVSHLGYHFTEPNGAFDFEGLWEFQAPQLQIMMRRGSMNSHMRFGLEFELNHCREPEPMWGVTTILIFSYQWKVGGGEL